MTEWRTIIDHPDYEVSEYGDVRNIRTGRVLNPFVGGSGGQMLTLDNTTVYVHRLVADAFIPNNDPDYWTVVIHVDGNKRNNNVDNLRWGTHSEALRYANGRRILLEDENIVFNSIASAAEYVGVSRRHMQYCLDTQYGYCNGRRLRYLRDKNL